MKLCVRTKKSGKSEMDFSPATARVRAGVTAWRPGLVPATRANVQLAAKYVARSSIRCTVAAHTQWTQDPTHPSTYPTSWYCLRSTRETST